MTNISKVFAISCYLQQYWFFLLFFCRIIPFLFWINETGLLKWEHIKQSPPRKINSLSHSKKFTIYLIIFIAVLNNSLFEYIFANLS